MQKTKIILHKDYEIASVDPRIFGGFPGAYGARRL